MTGAATIKVGLLQDFVNPEVADRVMLDALRMGFDEALDSGLIDRPVELVTRVVQGLPRGDFHSVLTACKELIAEGVVVIYGPWISENAVALRDYLETEGHVPALSMTGTDRWYGEWCFCINNGSLPEDGYLMTNYLTTKAVNTVAVVHDRSAIGEEYLHFFREACAFDGISIICEQSVSQIAENLDAQAAILKAAGADAVAYLGFGLPAVHLNTAMAALDWDPLRVMNTSFMTAPFIPQGWNALRGWIGCDQYDEENIVAQAMLDRFKNRYGYRPENFWPLINYDFANVIAHALAKAHPLSPMGVKHGLERIKMLPMATGGPGAIISFGPYLRRGWLTPNFIVMREVNPDFTGDLGLTGPCGSVLRHRYTPRVR